MPTKFGIELETISTISHEEMARRFHAAGLRAVQAGYAGSNYEIWQMKPDGSIAVPYPTTRRRRSAGARTQEDRDETRPTNNYRYGVEIVSRVLEWTDAGRAEVETAIATAADAVTVNTSCGFHVHVSADGLNADKLARLKQLWLNLEPTIFSYLPPSRRDNTFCRRGIGTDGRYFGLNLTCLPSKGTVEFRCHHGTVNAKKVLSWVSFCIALVEYAKGNGELPTLSQTVNATGADIIEVSFRNRSFTITPDGRAFNYAGTVYPTLKDAVLAIVKTLNAERTRPISDSFIQRNVKRAAMENAGMSAACQALNVEPEARSFLIERYNFAVRTWGTVNE